MKGEEDDQLRKRLNLITALGLTALEHTVKCDKQRYTCTADSHLCSCMSDLCCRVRFLTAQP
jgi:hypothetical protein